MVTYDFFISKIMFALMALLGILVLFFSGVYWGFTYHENMDYINVSTKEIKYIETINTKYTYNFIHDENKKYGDEVAPRIFKVVMFFVIISCLLIEIGYRYGAKYQYKDTFIERIKKLFKKIKTV